MNEILSLKGGKYVFSRPVCEEPWLPLLSVGAGVGSWLVPKVSPHQREDEGQRRGGPGGKDEQQAVAMVELEKNLFFAVFLYMEL